MWNDGALRRLLYRSRQLPPRDKKGRFTASAAVNDDIDWGDAWVNRAVGIAQSTHMKLHDAELGIGPALKQAEFDSLQKQTTDLLATLAIDVPSGRLATSLPCTGRDTWADLKKVKNDGNDAASVGARIWILAAVRGVRRGIVRGTQLRVAPDSNSVGIADDLFFPEDSAYYPADLSLDIDGEVRTASLQEAWDPYHLNAIEQALGNITVDTALKASKKRLCAPKTPPDLTDPNPDRNASARANPNLAALPSQPRQAQQQACEQLKTWCASWQAAMKQNPGDKSTLGQVLFEAAGVAPLFRRYKLFVMIVTQLNKMSDLLRAGQQATASATLVAPRKTATAAASFDAAGIYAMHEAVSAALARKGDDWLTTWVRQDTFDELRDVKDDVSALAKAPATDDTRDFGELTAKMSRAQVWRLLSEDQRERVRAIRRTVRDDPNPEEHLIEGLPKSVSITPPRSTEQDLTRRHSGHKKKAKKKAKPGQTSSSDQADDALMTAAINENLDALLVETTAHLEKLRLQKERKEANETGAKLMRAAQSGDAERARALIDAGADVNAQANNGFSALMLACQNGHKGCAQTLIDAGADVNATDEEDWTALMYAAQNGHEGCTRALIDAGAGVNATDGLLWLALVQAAQHGHEGCTRALIAAKASVNHTKNGETALMYAAQNGHEGCAQALIDAGADVNATDEEDWTALMLAAENGHAGCTQTLIDAGADLEKRTKVGKTALMLASENGHEEAVRKLLNAGAALKTVNNRGENALKLAGRFKHRNIVAALVKALQQRP